MTTDAPAPAPGTPPRSMRPFWILWSGQSLSLIGSQAVQFAVIWWLTAQTGSASVLATAAFVGLLPQVALGPAIGALVDRWHRKSVMLFADAVVAAASALLALLFLTGQASVPIVLSALFLRAVASAFHWPAMSASTTLMVPAEQLTRIQGLNQSLQGGLLIVSAPLGAWLCAALPMSGVMAVDVVTALPAILPLLFIHVPQPAAAAGSAGERPAGRMRALAREVLQGVRYIRDRRGHSALLGLAAVTNLCLVPAFSLLPLLVAEHGGGAVRLGWMNSTFGVGSIAGGIALGIWGGFRRRILTTLFGLVGLGLATLALGHASGITFLAAAGSIFAVGFMVPIVNGPVQALLQATVAPEMQGRVFTLYASLAGLAAPVGLALAAPIADLAGVTTWYTAGGLACVLMAVVGFATPAVMRIEEDTPAAPENGIPPGDEASRTESETPIAAEGT